MLKELSNLQDIFNYIYVEFGYYYFIMCSLILICSPEEPDIQESPLIFNSPDLIMCRQISIFLQNSSEMQTTQLVVIIQQHTFFQTASRLKYN